MPFLTLPRGTPGGLLLLSLSGSLTTPSVGQVRLTLVSERRTEKLHTTLTLESERQTHALTRLTLTSERRTGPFLAHAVQLGLISSRCTRRNYPAEVVTLTLLSERRTLRGPQAVTLTVTSERQTHSLTRLTLTAERKTVAAARVRLTLESERITGSLARLTLLSSRQTDRRELAPEEEDVVTVLCSFNGINLNNGTTTHVMADGNELGVDTPTYDIIRHYDDSLVLHDVRNELSTVSIKCRAHFSDATSLESWLAGLRAACAAGGSLSFAPRTGSPVRTFTIVPSPAPQVNEDNRYFIHHVATFDLQLTRRAE